jgi:hypothetical protein
MAAYSRGNMRWRLVIFLLPEQKPLRNENQDPDMPGHAGEQKTDLFEHGGILERWHEVKVGHLPPIAEQRRDLGVQLAVRKPLHNKISLLFNPVFAMVLPDPDPHRQYDLDSEAMKIKK